ncbi:MAG: CNNM domain-containing protein [Planctomycetota bacterium]
MIAAACLLISGLVLSAFFSGSETGFYRVTRVKLVVDALGGGRLSRVLLFLANRPSLFVATTLVGNNLANYVTSLAVVLGSQRLVPGGGTAVDLLAPMALAPLLFIGGELLPKNLFFEAPNRLLKRCAPGLAVCGVLFAPITVVLWAFSRLLELVTGASPQEAQLKIARRELNNLFAEGHEAGILEPVQRTLAQSMLLVAGKPISAFASPKGRVVRATTTMSKSDVLKLAQRHRRTLLPLEDPNNKRRLVGYLRMIDLCLDKGAALPEPMPLVELRDTDSCLSALRALSQSEDALGHVVSHTGETVGFVTGRELRLALLRDG